ncbi:apolipoprotein C-II isoform X2 [Monodelphis domestica]|uniref:apolipoprotein C-II isoform X2 n=2 Tax=Monodelphis domestica TaxID=13616 RepID=UPI0024E26A8A|nr:apolipoprotein C-II isoform X2 [Monodelphis domestica]
MSRHTSGASVLPAIMGAKSLPVLTFCLLLVLLLGSAQAARPRFRREESPTMLSKFQSQLYGYWESAKAKAHQIYEKVQIPAMDQNIRHAYNKGSEAMTTYTGILTDQIIHLLKGDQ